MLVLLAAHAGMSRQRKKGTNEFALFHGKCEQNRLCNGQKWRSGCEGRISLGKRRFRARYASHKATYDTIISIGHAMQSKRYTMLALLTRASKDTIFAPENS